jgi:MFS superfamily sulfate permease-like transporter
MHGVAIVLIVGQLGKLLGVSVDASRPIPIVVEVLGELPQASVATVIVSTVSLVLLLILRRFLAKLPGALIVVVGAIAAS